MVTSHLLIAQREERPLFHVHMVTSRLLTRPDGGGWTWVGNMRFKLYTDSMDFYSAESTCNKQTSGHLAAFRDQETYNKLTEVISLLVYFLYYQSVTNRVFTQMKVYTNWQLPMVSLTRNLQDL